MLSSLPHFRIVSCVSLSPNSQTSPPPHLQLTPELLAAKLFLLNSQLTIILHLGPLLPRKSLLDLRRALLLLVLADLLKMGLIRSYNTVRMGMIWGKEYVIPSAMRSVRKCAHILARGVSWQTPMAPWTWTARSMIVSAMFGTSTLA